MFVLVETRVELKFSRLLIGHLAEILVVIEGIGEIPLRGGMQLVYRFVSILCYVVFHDVVMLLHQRTVAVRDFAPLLRDSVLGLRALSLLYLR